MGTAPMNDDAKRAERDKNLVVRICATVQNVRDALYEWIEQEIKDQRYSVQIVRAINTGPIQTRAKEYEEAIDEIDRGQVEANKAQKSRVNEVVEGLGADPFNPFDEILYLEESTFRLERLARMMMQNRHRLDDLSNPDPSDEGSDPEADPQAS